MNEEKNYRLFIYWNNGFKYKFKRDKFSLYTQENANPIHSLVHSHQGDTDVRAGVGFSPLPTSVFLEDENGM